MYLYGFFDLAGWATALHAGRRPCTWTKSQIWGCRGPANLGRPFQQPMTLVKPPPPDLIARFLFFLSLATILAFSFFPPPGFTRRLISLPFHIVWSILVCIASVADPFLLSCKISTRGQPLVHPPSTQWHWLPRTRRRTSRA